MLAVSGCYLLTSSPGFDYYRDFISDRRNAILSILDLPAVAMTNHSESSSEHLLPYARRPDFHVGRATELTGRQRRLYRLLEILPGLASWVTLIGVLLLSAFAPFVAAYFIIAFAIYWILKTFFLSYHLRYNWKRLRYNLQVDWADRLQSMPHEHINHLVILPFYKESFDVVNGSVKALAAAKTPSERILVVLAVEERAGEEAAAIARAVANRWAGTFGAFLVSHHPSGLPGEMAGKGSNAAYAAEQARQQILDVKGLKYSEVLVSIFDIDTVIYPDYFNCLTWHFLTAEQPLKTSFQPIPVFNNNVWEAPALSRVVAMSSTFWEMVQQERPERMATFSSHSVSFQALYEVGYWQRNMVSEDSRIFWNLFIANNGDYRVIPLSYPVSMDANVGRNLWQTIAQIYRQHRRWTYGVENFVYVIYHFAHNKEISLRRRITIGLQQAEGYWSLVTNPIMLFILGWAPIFLGGQEFHQTVLSYNLPIMVRDLLIVAMFGLVFSSIVSLSLIPPRPDGASRFRYVVMALQWIMVPATMIIFSAIPGLDAQTRLMLGRYMGFWVTPKSRQ